MKKLGVSLVAILVGLPMMAKAADITAASTVSLDSGNHVAGVSFVQGAYNAAIGEINTNRTQINANTTAIAGKQDQLTNGTTDVSETVATTVRAAGTADNETLVTEAAVRAAIDASGSAVKGVQLNGSDLTPDANGKVNVTAVQSVTTGDSTSGNGTIKVDGTAVSVYGLGSAAFVNTGDLADTANTYDNTSSGLTATTIQDAIDEVATAVDSATNKQVEVYTTWNQITTGKADALVDPDPVTPTPEP